MIIFEEDISVSSIKCVLDKPDPKTLLTYKYALERDSLWKPLYFSSFKLDSRHIYFLTVFLILNYKFSARLT